ncbi:MAG: hypothetical protein O9346_12970 [Leptospiraceae bacterium]|jgi:hypothetical protein|nr:hypothetical protein [Leptospiraceae bacterium]MCZ8347322.1 hypothetical protein [Leptospiraceae bacterium]PJE03749.1 MAG: hypothetical protein CK427_04555 [Leptospira sp.]
MKFSFFITGYQIKRFLIVGAIRTLFIVLSFLTYNFLLTQIPGGIRFRLEIGMVSTLTVCILLYLPLVEKSQLFLKNKFLSEYLVEDSYASRLAYKRFDLNSLIQSVFPDMVKISGAESGRLGILKEDKSFDIYNYKRGRQKKIPSRGENSELNKLIGYLLKYKNGVSISETLSLSDINSIFISLRADYIIPFLFREKIFGFLAISNIPDLEAQKQLALLASQSALVIHNKNLSLQIVENIKYKQENESAIRIQNLLQKGKIPKIQNLDISLLANDPYTLIEFYQLDNMVWEFIIVSSGGPERSAGLLHSHILGKLYAKLGYFKVNSFIEIKTLIQSAFEKANWKDKYGYLIGKIINDSDIEILLEGNIFKVYSENNPNKQLTSMGWKNLIASYQFPIIIEVKGKQFLRISNS